MKQLVISLSTALLSISLFAMDNAPLELPHSSIELLPIALINCNTAFFAIKPNSIKVPLHGVTFSKKFSLDGTWGVQCNVHEIARGSDETLIPAGTVLYQKTDAHICVWTTSACVGPIKTKIYYGTNDWQQCSCAFSLVMIPKDDDNKDYKIELCTDGLHIDHKTPFNLKGLEHNYFKNFTYLAIQNCQKLQGTGGALNNILEVLTQLKYLDLSRTNLDEPVINVGHYTLEVLKMRYSNCTAIKRLTMPKLLSCRFCFCTSLNEINRDAVTIGDKCYISAVGCNPLTLSGEKNILIDQ